MPDRPGAPSRIPLRIPCRDADPSRLALDALNVCRAQLFALRHGLPLDEAPASGGVREFALSVDEGRLEGALLGLRVEDIPFGPVECGGPAAQEICRGLAVPAGPGTTAAPTRPPGRDAS